MADQKRFLVDVGLKDLSCPIRVPSKRVEEDQATVASISITARIMKEFQASWIDRFITVFHQHRGRIGMDTLRTNILDYAEALNSHSIQIEIKYPYFVEKIMPVSGEPCLVQYHCSYTAKLSAASDTPRIRFSMQIPCITTDPGSATQESGGLFGQLSSVDIAVQSADNIFPEDLVELVDRHALSPVYSYVHSADQAHFIHKIHTDQVSSVVMTDAIRDDLARDRRVEWYSVSTTNFGMLHSFSTVVSTEKSNWVPSS